MDYLTIENLSVRGMHGHYEHERRVEQEFVVSMKVGFDAHEAGKSDKLDDTIDYDQLRMITEEVFKGEPHYLLESLAQVIADRILSETPAREITISIQKPEVWPNGVPGAVITRTK